MQSSAELRDNLPIGSQRRADEIARIFAVVNEKHPSDALGWIYDTRRGTTFYQDNRLVPRDRIEQLLTALGNGGYQDVTAGIRRQRGIFMRVERDGRRGTFAATFPTGIRPLLCIGKVIPARRIPD